MTTQMSMSISVTSTGHFASLVDFVVALVMQLEEIYAAMGLVLV